MTDKTIVIIAICIAYYHIGGLSTTNIMRLTKGNTLTISSSTCVCGSCGAPINFFMQLPVISYVVCKGKCRKCGAQIPISGLILELVIMLGMGMVSALFDFSMLGILFSFIFYEIVRVIAVCILGRRENGFVKQYIIAMLWNIVPIILVEFMGLIGEVV